MSRCVTCGSEHRPGECPEIGETPAFFGDQGYIAGFIRVDELGGIVIQTGDDHYDFDLEAPKARRLAEAILTKHKAGISPVLTARIERLVEKYQDRYDSIETCRSQMIYSVIFLGLEGLEGADTAPEPTDTKH